MAHSSTTARALLPHFQPLLPASHAHMKARYLTLAETVAMLQYVAANKIRVHCSSFKFAHLLEIIIGPQIWYVFFCCW